MFEFETSILSNDETRMMKTMLMKEFEYDNDTDDEDSDDN